MLLACGAAGPLGCCQDTDATAGWQRTGHLTPRGLQGQSPGDTSYDSLFLGSREGTLGRCAVSASSMENSQGHRPRVPCCGHSVLSVMSLAIGQFELLQPFPLHWTVTSIPSITCSLWERTLHTLSWKCGGFAPQTCAVAEVHVGGSASHPACDGSVSRSPSPSTSHRAGRAKCLCVFSFPLGLSFKGRKLNFPGVASSVS